MKKQLFIENVIKGTENCTPHRLNRCTAWVLEHCDAENENISYVALRSYRTIVAVFDVDACTLYVFGNYSATTTQHVHKFMQFISDDYGTSIRVVYLYLRSDRIKTSMYHRETHYNRVGLVLHSSEKWTKQEYREAYHNDFADLITMY